MVWGWLLLSTVARLAESDASVGLREQRAAWLGTSSALRFVAWGVKDFKALENFMVLDPATLTRLKSVEFAKPTACWKEITRSLRIPETTRLMKVPELIGRRMVQTRIPFLVTPVHFALGMGLTELDVDVVVPPDVLFPVLQPQLDATLTTTIPRANRAQGFEYAVPLLLRAWCFQSFLKSKTMSIVDALKAAAPLLLSPADRDRLFDDIDNQRVRFPEQTCMWDVASRSLFFRCFTIGICSMCRTPVDIGHQTLLYNVKLSTSLSSSTRPLMRNPIAQMPSLTPHFQL